MDTVARNTGIKVEDLRAAMLDRAVWERSQREFRFRIDQSKYQEMLFNFLNSLGDVFGDR